jgi:pimeloyl-ACP methyl ester carboxylesterase
MGMRSVTTTLLLLSVGLSACTFGDATAPASAHQHLTTVDCPAEIPSMVLDGDVSCATLSVLTHHGQPGAATVKLFVTRLIATHPQPSQDPVLVLGGDLGVATDYATLGAQLEGLDREVIALDARGSGRSEPSLVCPEADSLPSSPLEVPVDAPKTRRDFLTAVEACHDRFVSQGVDLSAFDLQEMAADAEDLRIALGFDEWDVMALGTTSRVALEYLRDFPDHVHAAVLDSPEWPGVDPYIESIEATEHAVSELSAACTAGPTCNRLAPDFEGDVARVYRQLDAHPFEASYGARGRVLFDAGWFAVWLRQRLAFTRPPGTDVPYLVHQFALRSDRILRQEASKLLARQLCQGFLPNCWTHLVQGLGLYLTVMCRDVVPFTDPSGLSDLAEQSPGYQEAYVRGPYRDVCGTWDAGRGDPGVATPVTSDVPTLVIVGRFDPFGMAPYARTGASTLSASHVVLALVNGHGVTGTEQDVPRLCMVLMRDAWLDDPTAEPNASCQGEVPFDYPPEPG